MWLTKTQKSTWKLTGQIFTRDKLAPSARLSLYSFGGTMRKSAVDSRGCRSYAHSARHVQQHSPLAPPSGGHTAATSPRQVQEQEQGSRRSRRAPCGYGADIARAISPSPFRAGVFLAAGLLLLSFSAASAFELERNAFPPSRLRDPGSAGSSALAWAVVAGSPWALSGRFRPLSCGLYLPLQPITIFCNPSRQFAARAVSMNTRMGGEGGSRGLDPTEDRLRKWKVRVVRGGSPSQTSTTVDSTEVLYLEGN